VPIIAYIISYGAGHHNEKNNSKRGTRYILEFSERLEELDFADDMCLLSQSFREMNQKMKDLIKITKGAGLKINSQQSKIMRINGKTTEGFEIEGKPVEELHEFCYLGSMVTEDGGAETNVNIRINKAKGAFAMLRPLWKWKEI
jgi:hypothetical protein